MILFIKYTDGTTGELDLSTSSPWRREKLRAVWASQPHVEYATLR